MNFRKLLFILFAAAISVSAAVAEPAAAVHWYTITVVAGDSTLSFTGSSTMEADLMGTRLANGSASASPVELQNRRERFADPKANLPMGWHPYNEGERLFILPRTVLCFVELPGDPAAEVSRAQGETE